MKKTIDLPNYISGPKQANAFAEFYLGEGPTPRQKLQTLEMQALFFLLVEILETPEMNFTQLSLCPPDDDEGTIWINLIDADGEESDIADESDEIGAAAVLLMRELPYLNYTSRTSTFVDTLETEPLTHENKWELATKFFGEDASSAMQAELLEKSSPKARAKPRARL